MPATPRASLAHCPRSPLSNGSSGLLTASRLQHACVAQLGPFVLVSFHPPFPPSISRRHIWPWVVRASVTALDKRPSIPRERSISPGSSRWGATGRCDAHIPHKCHMLGSPRARSRLDGYCCDQILEEARTWRARFRP